MDASDYTQYRPPMFSIAYRITGSVADAEDIVQEAFLRPFVGCHTSRAGRVVGGTRTDKESSCESSSRGRPE